MSDLKSRPKQVICKAHDCISLTLPIIERERKKERYVCHRKQMHFNKSIEGKANTHTHWVKRLTASKPSELNLSNLSPCDRPPHFITTYLYHQRERKNHTANITKYSTLLHFFNEFVFANAIPASMILGLCGWLHCYMVV